MTDRAEAAARIARLRGDLAKLAEWRRLASAQRVTELETARQTLDAFVAESQPHGVMARVALAQAGRLDKRHEAAKAARDHAAAASLDAQQKKKVAERIAETLVQAEREAAARRELEGLIEALACRPDPASLP